MRRIRLAIVAGNLDDSADRQLDLLARRLPMRGYDVSIYRLAASRFDERLRCCGVRVSSFNDYAAWDPRIVFSLADDLAQTHPDIVYTWSDGADVCGTVAALKISAPIIIRASLGNLPRPPLHRTAGRLLSRWVQAHVAFSSGMRQHLADSGLPDNRLHIIPPAIELENPSESSLSHNIAAPGGDALADDDLPELPEGVRLVVAAGNIDRHQGLLRLLWAMGIIRYSGIKAHLWLVGEGNDAQQLSHQAEMMGIASLIHFLGPRGDLAAILRRADAFAMPLRHEVLTLAPLAAMREGVPVVLSRLPGNLELSADGRYGLLADADHPKDIASAIYRQLEDAERAKRIAVEARRHIAENYSVEQFIGRHDELLRRLIEQKKVNLEH